MNRRSQLAQLALEEAVTYQAPPSMYPAPQIPLVPSPFTPVYQTRLPALLRTPVVSSYGWMARGALPTIASVQAPSYPPTPSTAVTGPIAMTPLRQYIPTPLTTAAGPITSPAQSPVSPWVPQLVREFSAPSKAEVVDLDTQEYGTLLPPPKSVVQQPQQQRFVAAPVRPLQQNVAIAESLQAASWLARVAQDQQRKKDQQREKDRLKLQERRARLLREQQERNRRQQQERLRQAQRLLREQQRQHPKQPKLPKPLVVTALPNINPNLLDAYKESSFLPTPEQRIAHDKLVEAVNKVSEIAFHPSSAEPGSDQAAIEAQLGSKYTPVMMLLFQTTQDPAASDSEKYQAAQKFVNLYKQAEQEGFRLGMAKAGPAVDEFFAPIGQAVTPFVEVAAGAVEGVGDVLNWVFGAPAKQPAPPPKPSPYSGGGPVATPQIMGPPLPRAEVVDLDTGAPLPYTPPPVFDGRPTARPKPRPAEDWTDPSHGPGRGGGW